MTNSIEDLVNEFLDSYKDNARTVFLNVKDSALFTLGDLRMISLSAAKALKEIKTMNPEELENWLIINYIPHLKDENFPQPYSKGWGNAQHSFKKQFFDEKNKFENYEVINNKISFKEFLFEEDIKAVVSKKAMGLLGASHRADSDEEENLKDLLDVAKQEKTEKINSPVGPWILSVFRAATKTFVTAYPPKAYSKDPIFFVKD